MPATILTVAQQKGGAGKTTLAAQLAVALLKTKAANNKMAVATVDIDPQGSLSAWHAARAASLGARNRITHAQIQGWRLKKTVEQLALEHDIVIIDSPPHADTEAAMAMRESDVVIIPMQPSPMDLWACQPTIEIAIKENATPLIVLNRVTARAKLNDVIVKKLQSLNASVAGQSIGNRVAFAASMLEGKGVLETEKSSRAAQEIAALAKEIKGNQGLKKAA